MKRDERFDNEWWVRVNEDTSRESIIHRRTTPEICGRSSDVRTSSEFDHPKDQYQISLRKPRISGFPEIPLSKKNLDVFLYVGHNITEHKWWAFLVFLSLSFPNSSPRITLGRAFPPSHPHRYTAAVRWSMRVCACEGIGRKAPSQMYSYMLEVVERRVEKLTLRYLRGRFIAVAGFLPCDVILRDEKCKLYNLR